MEHHAYVLEETPEVGKELVYTFLQKELNIAHDQNPDVVEFTYSLLTVEDARKLISVAHQGGLRGKEKILIISASRVYNEAQNALLKVFEEPPQGTVLFLIVPVLGLLLPTLRSRLMMLSASRENVVAESAKAFVKMSLEKRTAFIKRLATGKDEEDRRAHRDEALAVVNGVEALAYRKPLTKETRVLLSDLSSLRDFLHDRSLSVRMILEHLSLVLPKSMK